MVLTDSRAEAGCTASSMTWDGSLTPSVLILTSLSDGPKHGYAIMTDVAAFSDVRMEPGSRARTSAVLRAW